MINNWVEEYKKYHAEHSDYGNGGAVKFHWQHINDLINIPENTVADKGYD